MSYLFPRATAMAHALRMLNALGPHCERIEIAGSLRRGKALVKDIDIACVPKNAAQSSLFGTSTDLAQTDFYAAVRSVLFDITAGGTRLLRGIAAVPDDGKLTCDVYIATPETWATLLLIRTGSAEHNIWMCSRAREAGGKLHADGAGLELAGQYDPVAQRSVNRRVLRPQSEAEIFNALGLPCIEPEKREMWDGKPMWMGSAASPARVGAREPGEEG